MLRLLPLLFLAFGFSGRAQETTIFSDALSAHLEKYRIKADRAYRLNQTDRAVFLFDSLVNNCLKGSRLDNFRMKDLDKNEIHLEEFEKPVYLMTSSSWIVVSEGEISALNQLARRYHGQINFVLLLWDKHESASRISRKYDPKIRILYVDEAQNNNPGIIKNLKHSLGFPTSFLLNKQKEIVDISRKPSHPYGISYKSSFNLYQSSFEKAVQQLLDKKLFPVDTEISDAGREKLEQWSPQAAK